jgi:hypothetical protein
MAVGGNSGIAQKRAVGAAGAQCGYARDAWPEGVSADAPSKHTLGCNAAVTLHPRARYRGEEVTAIQNCSNGQVGRQQSPIRKT